MVAQDGPRGSTDAVELVARVASLAHSVGQWQLAEDYADLDAIGAPRLCQLHAKGLLPPEMREALISRFGESREYRDAMAAAVRDMQPGRRAVRWDEVREWQQDEALRRPMAAMLATALIVRQRRGHRRALGVLGGLPSTLGGAILAGSEESLGTALADEVEPAPAVEEIPIVDEAEHSVGSARLAHAPGRPLIEPAGHCRFSLRLPPLPPPLQQWWGTERLALRTEVGQGAVDFPLLVEEHPDPEFPLWVTARLELGFGEYGDEFDIARCRVVMLPPEAAAA